jgi:hypothetical protein
VIEGENTADAGQSQELSKKPVHKRPGRSRFFKTAAGRKLIARFKAEYSGRPQPKNLGRTGPSSRDRSPAISDWELARSVALGKPIPSMKSNTLSARAKSLGLDYRTEIFCDAGNPFSDSDLHELRKRSGFTGERFEKLTGVSADGGPRQGFRIAAHAQKVIRWRDRTLQSLFRQSSRSYKHQRILKTLVPNLSDLDALLRECFGEIQKEIAGELTLTSVGEFVARRAKGLAKKSPHAGLWGEMLRYLAELAAHDAASKFLDESLKSLSQRTDVAGFARELLAARYGTTVWNVKRALPRGTQPIPAREMCGVILAYTEDATGSAAQPVTEKEMQTTKSGRDRTASRGRNRGGQKGPREITKLRILVAASYEIDGVGRYRAAPTLYPLQSDKDRAYDSFKDLYDSHAGRIAEKKKQLASFSGQDRKTLTHDALKRIAALDRGK